MKTLLINGSPRKNGNTAFLLSQLKSNLQGEVSEIIAYDNKISPCVDCRACMKKRGCVIDDEMRIIYQDSFDTVVIASPVYMSNLTPPLMGIASRFQANYCARRFLKDEYRPIPKKGALILVGGGEGNPKAAISTSKWMLKEMNAQCLEEHMVFSLQTDTLPVDKDYKAIQRIFDVASYLNGTV